MEFSGRIIGIDESGKGDFFGPLVVAAVYADEAGAARLVQLGARDSKTLTDKRVTAVDQAIREQFIHFVHVIAPAQYNIAYARVKNLNRLLAAGHAAAIVAVLERLLPQQRAGCRAISDKFGKDERLETALAEIGCRIDVTQIHRGEEVPQVAAASVLARAEFIRRLGALSEEIGIKLPKGAAAQVDDAGRRVVARWGPDILTRVAKTHFKNYGRVLAGAGLL